MQKRTSETRFSANFASIHVLPTFFSNFFNQSFLFPFPCPMYATRWFDPYTNGPLRARFCNIVPKSALSSLTVPPSNTKEDTAFQKKCIVEVRKTLSGQLSCVFCVCVLLSVCCCCFSELIFWVSLEFSFIRGGVQLETKAQISAILGTMLQKRAL